MTRLSSIAHTRITRKPHTKARAGLALAVLASAILPALSHAQTSGTWVPVKDFTVNGSGNWYDATNWTGAVPDNGGTASFTSVLRGVIVNVPYSSYSATSGAINGGYQQVAALGVTIPDGQIPVISSIVQTSGDNVGITGSSTATLSVAAAGGTFNVAPSVSSSGAKANFGLVVLTNLTGGVLTKTGTGVLELDSLKVNTAGLVSSGGLVQFAGGNTSPGAGLLLRDSARSITLNGGGFGSAFDTLRVEPSVTVTAAGGTIDTLSTMNLNAPLRGTGNLTKTGFGNLLLSSISGPSDFSGAITVTGTGQLVLGYTQGTALTNVAGLDVSGVLAVNPTTAFSSSQNNNSRLNDSATIRLRGGDLVLYNGQTRDVSNAITGETTTETVGAINLDSGASRIALVTLNGGSTTLTTPTISRANNYSLAVIRGDGLTRNTNTGAGSNFIVTTPIPMIGGGTSSSFTVSIIPWAVGASTSGVASALSPIGDLDSTTFALLSQDSTTGAIFPLTASNYGSSISASTGNNNVRRTTTIDLTTASVVNSLTVNSGVQVTSANASTLTVNSGVVVTYGNGPTTQITAPLAFPNAVPGILYTVGGTVISAPITSANAGVIKALGGLLTLSGQSTFTGSFVNTNGPVRFAGNVKADGTASPFGAGNAPVILAPGNDYNAGKESPTTTQLIMTSSGTFDKPIIVTGASNGTAELQTYYAATSDIFWTQNGTVTLNRDLALFFSNNAIAGGPSGIFNGVISGTGGISDRVGTTTFQQETFYPSTIQFNAVNTFSGPVNMNAGTFIVNNNNALGTGTINVNGGFVPDFDPVNFTLSTKFQTPTLQILGPTRTLANGLSLNVSLTITGSDLTLSGPVTLGNQFSNDSNSGIFLFVNNANTTLSGVVSNGGLIKRGTGNLIFTNNNNSFLLPLYVRTGSASIGNGGTTGNLVADTELEVDTVLNLNRSNDFTYPGSVTAHQNPGQQLDLTPSGIINKLGNGNATLTGQYLRPITVNVNAGTLQIGNSSATPDVRIPELNVNTGTLAFGGPSLPGAYNYLGKLNSIYVNDGQKLQITPRLAASDKAKVLVVDNGGAPNLSSTGFFDVTNNDVIFVGGAYFIDDIRNLVKRWNDNRVAASGLGSSVATSNQTLAVFPNYFYDTAGTYQQYFTTYDGISLTDQDVIVKFTWVGDVNLDGIVDGKDGKIILESAIFGSYMNPQNTGWMIGDVNYDGLVNGTDYGLWNTARLASGGVSLGSGLDAGSSTTSIPEPSAFALVAAALPLATRRRRA
jgi:hypothetical protein